MLRFVGGVIAVGLEKNILDGYRFLAQQYVDGDEVYVLGFSSGAYTARSHVGLIRNCGLVKNKQLALRIAIAYGIYRMCNDGPDSATAEQFKAKFSREIGVKVSWCLGYGRCPRDPLDLLKAVNLHFYEFHDTKLSKIVANAYQAIAVDEHRVDYGVCLWEPEADSGQVLEQRWFAGAHCDIGEGLYARKNPRRYPLFVGRSSGTKSSILRCRSDARRIGSTNRRATAYRRLTEYAKRRR